MGMRAKFRSTRKGENQRGKATVTRVRRGGCYGGDTSPSEFVNEQLSSDYGDPVAWPQNENQTLRDGCGIFAA